MFEKLGDELRKKFSRKDDLSKQLEIVKVFDIYKEEIEKLFPLEKGINPISLRNKVLRVRMASSVTASELRLRGGEILRNINRVLGREVVKRIVYGV